MIKVSKSQIPLYASTDYLIIGGSFGGISAAYQLAKNGKSVIILDSGTFLGREITSYLRPWEISTEGMPPFLRKIIK